MRISLARLGVGIPITPSAATNAVSKTVFCSNSSSYPAWVGRPAVNGSTGSDGKDADETHFERHESTVANPRFHCAPRWTHRRIQTQLACSMMQHLRAQHRKHSIESRAFWSSSGLVIKLCRVISDSASLLSLLAAYQPSLSNF